MLRGGKEKLNEGIRRASLVLAYPLDATQGVSERILAPSHGQHRSPTAWDCIGSFTKSLIIPTMHKGATPQIIHSHSSQTFQLLHSMITVIAYRVLTRYLQNVFLFSCCVLHKLVPSDCLSLTFQGSISYLVSKYIVYFCNLSSVNYKYIIWYLSVLSLCVF